MLLPVGAHRRSRPSLRRFLACGVTALWLAGCGNEPDGAGPTGLPPLRVAATVRGNPELTVGAFVEVETSGGARQVLVRHGDDPSFGYQTPPVDVAEDGTATVHLLALLPDATTYLEVEARDDAGRVATTEVLEFRAPPLPEGFEYFVSVPVDDGTVSGWMLGTYNHTIGRVLMMFDRRGRIGWYHRLAENPGYVGASFRRANGNFVAWEPYQNALLEVTPTGQEVARWTTEGGLDNHEGRELPGGVLVALGAELRTWDTTPYFLTGKEDATRVDQTIVEIYPDGTSRKIYSSWGKVEFDDIVPAPGLVINPLFLSICHANAVSPTVDGHYLISCRNLSSVYKVNRDTGDIMWRLGGARSDFEFVDDPLGRFSAQHDALMLPDGKVRVFDNGNGHAPPRSRVATYELDEARGTARLVWSWEPGDGSYTLVAGSARATEPGRLLVHVPVTNTLYEVDQDGVVRWKLEGALGGGFFRVVWCRDLYSGPSEPY